MLFLKTLALLAASLLVALPIVALAPAAQAAHMCDEGIPCCHVIDCFPQVYTVLDRLCGKLGCNIGIDDALFP